MQRKGKKEELGAYMPTYAGQGILTESYRKPVVNDEGMVRIPSLSYSRAWL